MVTYEEVEKYLLQLERDRDSIKNKKAELQILQNTGWNSSSGFDAPAVQPSGKSDPVWNTYSYAMKLEKEIKELENQYVLDTLERKALIEKVKKPLHYDILYGRYILHKSLAEIAREKNYCYEHVRNNHKKAVEEVRKFIIL